MAKKRKKSSVGLIILLVIVVAAVAGVLIYHYDKKTTKNLAVTNSTSKPKAATSTPTAPSLPSTSSSNPGGAIDKNGKTTGSLPPSSEWVSSASGAITLQQPNSVSPVSNGDPISGTASVDKVSFILTDNSVGLIDQGTLNVVNGKFSGLMEFQSHSSNGKLEVYYSNPTNGAEEDVITIDVSFSN